MMTLCTAAAPAAAALAPIPEATLHQRAALVVVADVVAIDDSERHETAEQRLTHYRAQVRVRETLKGRTPSVGETLAIRYWRRVWLPGARPVIGNDGHHGLPRIGDRLRLYLSGESGGQHDVLMPSGLVRLGPKPD